MAIAGEILKLQNTLRELKPFVDSITSAEQYINKMTSLVEQDILSQEKVDAILGKFKDSIKAEVNKIITKEASKAIDTATAATAEANDKIKGMAPIIQGVPVIIPPPASFAANNIAILAPVPSLISDLSSTLDALTGLTG